MCMFCGELEEVNRIVDMPLSHPCGNILHLRLV